MTEYSVYGADRAPICRKWSKIDLCGPKSSHGHDLIIPHTILWLRSRNFERRYIAQMITNCYQCVHITHERLKLSLKSVLVEISKFFHDQESPDQI